MCRIYIPILKRQMVPADFLICLLVVGLKRLGSTLQGITAPSFKILHMLQYLCICIHVCLCVLYVLEILKELYIYQLMVMQGLCSEGNVLQCLQ